MSLGGAAAEVVLVCGGTGRTGVRVVSELFKAGYVVRVLARDVAAARQKLDILARLNRGRLEIAEGDMTDPKTLVNAMEQVEQVIIVIGTQKLSNPVSELLNRSSSQRRKDHPRMVELEGVRALCAVAAVRKEQVKKIVYMTGMGVGLPNQPLVALLNAFTSFSPFYKCHAENCVRTCGVPYTIIRPAVLLETPMPDGVKATLIQAGSARLKSTLPVSRESLAKLLVGALKENAVTGTTLDCFGSKNEDREVFQILKGSFKPDTDKVPFELEKTALVHLRNGKLVLLAFLVVMSILLLFLVKFLIRKFI